MSELKASTQEHLDIEDIRDDLLLLKDGTAAAVLETTAVNFDLLSEREQDAMIMAYGQLLNSLSFPIQVVIRSKRMDITEYLLSLKEREEKQTNPYLREKIKEYRRYILELVSKNEVLDKHFYVVVPYQEITLPAPAAFSPLSLLTGKKPPPRFDKSALLERAKIDLKPKKESLVKQFSSIGLKVRQLTSQELVELFYGIYNPDTAHEQKVRFSAAEYTSYFVEPAVGG